MVDFLILSHLFCRSLIIVYLQVGDRDDSNLYISMKLKAAAEVKLSMFLHRIRMFLACSDWIIVCPSVLISFRSSTDWNKCHTYETSQDCHRG